MWIHFVKNRAINYCKEKPENQFGIKLEVDLNYGMRCLSKEAKLTYNFRQFLTKIQAQKGQLKSRSNHYIGLNII